MKKLPTMALKIELVLVQLAFKFTAHYGMQKCGFQNLVSATNNGFNFQIIDSLMKSTCNNCGYAQL